MSERPPLLSRTCGLRTTVLCPVSSWPQGQASLGPPRRHVGPTHHSLPRFLANLTTPQVSLLGPIPPFQGLEQLYFLFAKSIIRKGGK